MYSTTYRKYNDFACLHVLCGTGIEFNNLAIFADLEFKFKYFRENVLHVLQDQISPTDGTFEIKSSAIFAD